VSSSLPRGTAAILVAILVTGASLGLLPSVASAPSTAGSVPWVPQPAESTHGLVPPSNGATPASAAGGVTGLPAPPSPLSVSAPEGTTAALAAHIQSAGVPLRYAFLPDLNGRSADAIRNGHIEPTYTTSPAPMGLADLGLANESGAIVKESAAAPEGSGIHVRLAWGGLDATVTKSS